ncbi:hypothetical protein V5O48_013896 [Marasmius crinis-equi]|uniref:DUF6534 domain-containing protein n=1 Tax=Marasmius crinis-equi TaxID=585013 RepID=A0ABR3EYT9_9AGAR
MSSSGTEGNVGSPSPVIAADTVTAIGPIFIANLINWMLMGTLVMQVYTYYLRFAKDRLWIRLLVAILFTLDVAHTFLLTAHGWFFAVEIWGHPERLDELPWPVQVISLAGGTSRYPFSRIVVHIKMTEDHQILVSIMVQIFYAWRIWLLSKTKLLRVLAVLIVMLALMQGLAAIVSGLVLLIGGPTQENLIRLHPGFSVWLAGSLTTDILITGCMTHILYKARADTRYLNSETMLTRMINNTVQTGAITVICAAVDLALFTKYVNTNYHYVPCVQFLLSSSVDPDGKPEKRAYILGKLYSNSLMLNLNLRKPQNLSSASFTTGVSDTLPMHYFRSADNTGRKTASSSRGVRTTKLEPEQSVIGSVIPSHGQHENDVAKLDRSSLEPNMPTPVNIRIHTVTTSQQDHRPDRDAED